MGSSFGKTYGYGHAQVDRRRPQAFGTCDRCGIQYQRKDLRYQFDFQGGASMTNLQLLVCHSCYDKPAQFNKLLVIPPDPLPVPNSRPEPYETDFTNVRMLQNGLENGSTPRILEDETQYRIPDNSVNDADEPGP